MNFHEGGPSNFSFNAPSPPSDGEEQPSVMIKNEFHLIDQQQMVLSQLISATVAAEYFHESDNLQHGGSIPGHIKVDGLGRPGLSPHQKITAALRILAYGTSADSTDEYIKIGESTAIESLKRFCWAMVEVFGDWYLRSPNTEDIERILLIGKQRGFSGMLGSLDCVHWKWKNCPTGWAGQYTGRSGKPTIILEAVADYELWIWHAYFGLPGSNNNINVLSKFHLFANLANGVAPSANYVIQGKEYTLGYYLADGIYPKWATLVQTIHNPQGPKRQYFAARH
ncbi:uncharacterized protein [Henckelia pumila]|uniref:uncharacterized protein n=1 Tax=Henckelia pumila TaxID=405737 RepID=UPI003C6E9C04